MPRLGGKVRKKQQIEFDDDQWSCTVCTFQNKIGTYKCSVCEAPRGSSTRKGGRIAEQIIQKQQQTQLFAQYGDGSTSTIEAGLKPRGGMEEVRRKSMVDNGASGSHLNGNFSEDDDESISEQSSIASDTRPASRLSGRRQYSRKPSESEESLDVESKSARGGKRKPKNEKRKRGRKKKEDESSEEEMIIRKTPAKRPRGRPRQDSGSDSDDIPESPNTSTSQPAKKRTKTPKRNENTLQKMLAKKVQAKLSLIGKHENIDRSSGVDFTVSYGGTSFVVTEYKTKRAPSHEEEKVTIKTENGDDNKANEKLNDKTNGLAKPPEGEVKNERKEDEAGTSKTLEIQENKACEDDAAPADVDAKQIATVNAKIQKLSSKLNQKQNKPPSLEEKFKNAFKNTDPKNPSKSATEMSKQIETTKEVKEHLQRSKQLEKQETDSPKEALQKENVPNAIAQPKENSTNVPIPISPPTPKKIPSQIIPLSSPSQSPVIRQHQLTSPIRPPHAHTRYVNPSSGPQIPPGSSPSNHPRMSNQNVPQSSVTQPIQNYHTSTLATPTHPATPKTQQPIRGIPLGKPIEVKKGGNRPPPASPTLSRPSNQPVTSPGHLARPILGQTGARGPMPVMRPGQPRPMRSTFNPAGRPGFQPNLPRHAHSQIRGAGPTRPEMKRGPRPVHPVQRMPSQTRTQRPHFSGASGPSRQSLPPGPSRPMGMRPGAPPAPPGVGAPIRAVQSTFQQGSATRAPSHPARPQGLKPIRGLPIGASVKIKTNVKTNPANKQPLIVKSDHGKSTETQNEQKPCEQSVSKQPGIQNQNGEKGALRRPEQPQNAVNSQPPTPLTTASIVSKSVKAEKQQESAPTENPSRDKVLPPPLPDNDSASEDELQIDESVEPDAIG